MLPNLVKTEDNVFLMETATSVNVLQPTLDPTANKVEHNTIYFLGRKLNSTLMLLSVMLRKYHQCAFLIINVSTTKSNWCTWKTWTLVISNGEIIQRTVNAVRRIQSVLSVTSFSKYLFGDRNLPVLILQLCKQTPVLLSLARMEANVSPVVTVTSVSALQLSPEPTVNSVNILHTSLSIRSYMYR